MTLQESPGAPRMRLPEPGAQTPFGHTGQHSPVADAGGYHIMTWGCQMNEEDSEQMSLYLERMGYHAVDDAACARIVLLNTCSVRAKPEEKVWSMLGRLRALKQHNPDLIIGVCGCMAQAENAEIRRRAPHVDLVVGTGHIASLPELIESLQRGESLPAPAPAADTIPLTALRASHSPAAGREPQTALTLPTRKGAIVTDVPARIVERKPKLKAHVPIMYGCDKFCTFCIVPLTRGRERSRPTREILAEIQDLARQGTQEITLLGQTVNSYGKNLAEGRVPFARLLEQIDRIPGIHRVRFTSPYPRDFTDELIDALADLETVCEHVHLPLQVGDDTLLEKMHRGYTVARFLEIVEKLRLRVPGIAITTDLMLGYPGETDAQYRNTLKVVEQVRFDAAFMFAYSPRPGTRAAAEEEHVPHAVKIERLQALVDLQNRITVETNRAQVGQTFEVLVEGRSPKDPAKLTGLTRTGKTMNFPIPATAELSPESLVGKRVAVRAVEGHLYGFQGAMCTDPNLVAAGTAE